YDSAIKKILRRDNTGIIELPYTYKFTNNDLKIIPAEEGLFNFILNDKTDTNIVNSLNNDSAAIVKISYYVYNVKKENDKLKNTRMIYLIYKRN
ncbi:MAG TPA: hypothetical protein PLM75_11345, partial [bacterium]|nr:hypothetical protein [bacterium]